MSDLRNDLLVNEFKKCLKIVDPKTNFTLETEDKSISEKVFEMSLKNSKKSSKNMVFSCFENDKTEPETQLGDRFYAKFTEDNLWYPGEVVEVYKDTVLIRFDVYENEQECWVNELRPIDYDWENDNSDRENCGKDGSVEYVLATPFGEILTDKVCENDSIKEKKSVDANGNIVTVTKYGTHTKFENTDSESSFGSSCSEIKDYKKTNESKKVGIDPDISVGMPPLPEINIPANQNELKALLAAWYTAGYYAAKYEISNK